MPVSIIKSAMIASVVSLLLLISSPSLANERDVKLVLQITVDGLRNDMLYRSQPHYRDGGFNYLLKTGAIYTNAHYLHANTETIVGHTSLATGATPAVHGMTGNVWFDRKSSELAYNIEDPDAPLLPTRSVERQGAQVDPAQKMARTQGRSPKAILVPTLGDSLSAFYDGNSKIFAVSGKDRSAVAMAGHTGKAFWYSTNNGDFITSKYYYDNYPQWTSSWNERRKAETFAGKTWTLLDKPDSYQRIGSDDRPYEADLKGYGRTFPHGFGTIEHPLFQTRLVVSPVGDQLTLDFSKVLIENENLGQDNVPDYLSISFSGVDAVNHFFGPNSLENEDVIRQLDVTLAELFAFIDKKVGLKNTLIVLSADHGMADMPEYMSDLGYKVGRLYSDDVVKIANKAGKDLFGIEAITHFFFRPYLYLDDVKLAQNKLDKQVVEQAIAAVLTEHEGIALAVPESGLPALQAPAIYQQIRNNYHPLRSGDIYIAQSPYWFMFERGPVVAMHGSPWRYDTHVPIIFAGEGIKNSTVSRLVHPIDVAPTLAALLKITPPSSSQGSVLTEVVK
ncbi:MAG: alkaline phosphatase family protein [Pseudomonadales bacterium]